MIRSVAIAAIALGACGPDSTPFAVRLSLEFDRNHAQSCVSNVCESIPMSCDAMVLVRVVDAEDGSSYLNECTAIAGNQDLCGIGAVDLDDRLIPNTMVRVQVAVWPASALPDGRCPTVLFSDDGKARTDGTNDPPPAIAGEEFFEVGSASTATVTLGCIDELSLDTPECRGGGNVRVGAGVLDFDTNLSVSPTVQNLVVSIGEPKLFGGNWSLSSSETVVLERHVIGGIPVWEGPEMGGVDLTFEEAACIQVFEDQTPDVTSTLACRPASAADTELDLNGVLVKKAAQELVKTALGGAFPTGGIVIGRVLDETGQPAAGVTVEPAETSGPATVIYLSDDMTATTTGAVTTTSGAFISLNAPFDTTWQVMGEDVVEKQLGGRVTGKVTVIELQLMEP